MEIVAKRIANRVLKDKLASKTNASDPYYEYVPSHDANGISRGKPRRQKKPPPPGLTKKEEKVLKKVTRRAYRLDNCLNICGFKLGWSAIFGIIPGVGDVLDTLMAMLLVYRPCTQLDIPASLRSRMLFNITIDFMIGLVPVLGDVADAVWRCNTKNVSLLYAYLHELGQERLKESEKSVNPAQQSHEHAMAEGDQPLHQIDRSQQLEAPLTQTAPTAPTSNRLQDSQATTRADGGGQPRRSGGGWLDRFARSSQRDPSHPTRDPENAE